MRTVRYHEEARAEFLHDVRYYARLSAGLSERYDEAVRAAEVRAAESPDLWPKYVHKTRRIVDRRFKFSLVYLFTESEIAVIAIAPFRRKPGYWKARLGEG
ncbi:MAG: type II toxin-antitoxin system RelE/ParE family toxin [Proteobacteria bacterium]|nr:type II toxin-antitoxin system RelE/ParE family toxin [Pseudomonadota bacterium]